MSIPRILTFHKLCPEITYGSTNYSPRRFRGLLTALREHGYQFARLDDVIGETAGERAVAITFDDGYGHLADYLPDLIEEFNLRPTVFVPTNFIGKSSRWDYTRFLRTDSHLSREQITQLADMGVEFGSHGHTHVSLTELTGERLTRELLAPRRILEDIVGAAVTKISYPFGRINETVVEAARQAGYSSGFTTRFPSEVDERLSIGRCGVWFFDTPLSVVHKLEPGTWLHRIEQIKADATRQLSSGTVFLNRLTGHSRSE